MQIELIQPGANVADLSVSGAVIVIGDIAIDTAQRQQDSAVVVEIRSNNGAIQEGGEGAYVALIRIPARQYIAVEVEQDGDSDEAGHEQQAVPLDPDAVIVTLWPFA